MRLAILMTIGSPWSRNAASWLARLNHTVHVIDFKQRREGYLDANPQSQLGEIDAFKSSMAGMHLIDSSVSSDLRYAFGALALRRIVRECRADAVLSLYSGGFLLMAYLSGCRPYMTYVVGSDILTVRGVKKWVCRRALGAAQTVLVNGMYLAEQTRKLAPDANVMPLYLGVDAEKYSPGSPPESPVHVVCTRGFLPVYNNDYLIRALALLPEGVPEFRVTFVSSGPTLASVHALADDILPPDMRRRVEFLGGIPKSRLLSVLRSSHVYVSVSRSDGTSISMLEALSCGLYPLLSDIPQNREWIGEGSENGLLVPLDRPQELADALVTAIGDQQRRRAAAACNRQLILERANSVQTMNSLSMMLESVSPAHDT